MGRRYRSTLIAYGLVLFLFAVGTVHSPTSPMGQHPDPARVRAVHRYHRFRPDAVHPDRGHRPFRPVDAHRRGSAELSGAEGERRRPPRLRSGCRAGCYRRAGQWDRGRLRGCPADHHDARDQRGFAGPPPGAPTADLILAASGVDKRGDRRGPRHPRDRPHLDRGRRIAIVLLSATSFGRRLYAVDQRLGRSPRRIRVRRVLLVPYIVSALGVVVRGLVAHGVHGPGVPYDGHPYLFTGAVAVAVGGTSILGG